jgi:D-sedoheptulose 7-phosphate isomerase|tara:strand:- start:44 stop:613 length:570 start_codon:yes stop_codon:yes gene_type:complete
MIDIKRTIKDSAEIKHLMLNDCINEIESAVDIMIDAAEKGNKILWCGNGGSAADSQHMAAELMGGLRSHERPAIASLALTTDSSFITAWSNDTDFDSIFSRQIEALGHEGDILIGISTSGNSTNVINAINAAKAKKLKVIILTGKTGGKMVGMGDVSICIPSNDTQRIQECHLLVEHILCESVEESMLT